MTHYAVKKAQRVLAEVDRDVKELEREIEFAKIENLYCGSVYPSPERFMQGCETALCLFCAEWLGMQDAYWLAKAGLGGLCVDLQGDKLEQMRELYPEGWGFVKADVYGFAEAAKREEMCWDVVTLDPWTGQFEKCAALIETWCTLARKVVVLGHGNYRLSAPAAPNGWQHVETIRRSDFKGGVNWLVYVRD
jgi:hypothetical protein